MLCELLDENEALAGFALIRLNSALLLVNFCFLEWDRFIAELAGDKALVTMIIVIFLVLFVDDSSAKITRNLNYLLANFAGAAVSLLDFFHYAKC
jgi:glucose uptake protein GlcU